MGHRRTGPREGLAAALVAAAMLAACQDTEAQVPRVEFTRVPRASRGGPDSRLTSFEGRVVGARPGQRIVLYARSGAWYVQPFTDAPFTDVEADSRWANRTRQHTEYAALLVEPGHQPAARLDALPEAGGTVLAVAAVPGTPQPWQTLWFRGVCVAAFALALAASFRWRMRHVLRQVNLRFEERLAERTRIAQELHDTLLQGFMSASMQLHLALGALPEASPEKTHLARVLAMMRQVIEEGRQALQGLRSDRGEQDDLEPSFARIRDEMDVPESTAFRVSVEGEVRALNPLIRDEVYRIGREALVNAIRHARAGAIGAVIGFGSRDLRLVVQDDGCGMAPAVLGAGRAGHWGLSGMKERAQRIGARLEIRSREGAGTQVELAVPGSVAFASGPARRGWWGRLLGGDPRALDPGRERAR
jgi:signal transduction histidine kinase